MLEMKSDETGLASARYLLADTPQWDSEAGTLERISTRFSADSAEWVRESEKIDLDQAILEVAAASKLPAEHARTALLCSTAYSTAHTTEESPLEMSNPEPLYVEARPLLEMRANEAQAKQRAFELSMTLPDREARVIEDTGETIAIYRGGALYSPATGEQLTPAV